MWTASLHTPQSDGQLPRYLRPAVPLTFSRVNRALCINLRFFPVPFLFGLHVRSLISIHFIVSEVLPTREFRLSSER